MSFFSEGGSEMEDPAGRSWLEMIDNFELWIFNF